MQVSITARHGGLTGPFKVYVNERLKRLNRYGSRAKEARVVFSLERFNYISEIILTGKRFRIVAVGKARDLEGSFDKGMGNVTKQLKRFRSRTKDHKVAGIKRPSAKKKSQDSFSPRIIRTAPSGIKPMSPEEAALEMEAFNKDFIAFNNSENEKASVLYRRKDGNYGLIEP